MKRTAFKRTLGLGVCLFLGSSSLALSKEHVIGQKGKKFSQSEITINKGDTILFKNDDDTVHNVFSTSPNGKFNGGAQAAQVGDKEGGEHRQKFDQAGEVEVRCAIHTEMILKVKVQ